MAEAYTIPAILAFTILALISLVGILYIKASTPNRPVGYVLITISILLFITMLYLMYQKTLELTGGGNGPEEGFIYVVDSAIVLAAPFVELVPDKQK
jgi:hypothetical protein